MLNMKSIRNLLFAFVAAVLTVAVFTGCGEDREGQSSRKEAAAIPEAPTGLFLDLAEVFSPEEEEMLSETIRHFEAKTGGQLRVLTVETTGNFPIEEFSLDVTNKWKLGYEGKGNCVLLTLAIRDHRDRIEVGRSWESVLTDVRCGEILRSIVPELRAEQYAEACAKAVRSLEAFFPENEAR